jgi:hypothetical protein
VQTVTLSVTVSVASDIETRYSFVTDCLMILLLLLRFCSVGFSHVMRYGLHRLSVTIYVTASVIYITDFSNGLTPSSSRRP